MKKVERGVGCIVQRVDALKEKERLGKCFSLKETKELSYGKNAIKDIKYVCVSKIFPESFEGKVEYTVTLCKFTFR